jgi:hypothetical protein
MSRIFVKPAPQPDGRPALKVRKPVNGYLAEEGEEVNAESYWLRRIADGDVVEGDAPAAAAPAGTLAVEIGNGRTTKRAS